MMTNLEKLIQVLGETFPGTKFDAKEIADIIGSCDCIICDNECATKGINCPYEIYWEEEYILHDLKPEPDANITTGYVVFVDDEGTEIPYSGCIHPTYSHAMDEMDQAEYHGWATSIQVVKFVFTSKGGGKNA